MAIKGLDAPNGAIAYAKRYGNETYRFNIKGFQQGKARQADAIADRQTGAA